ncbi:hypothetical protein EYC80_002098 [Monilinia laxa]|uniref:Uncharacterized protein n=1 Tax=Monilinia laxa TaxID=61186 RepID=A0A5N6K385_MONLA|nr:hypothetical protein EYC80_002098 [Monilinia laxa]
MTMKSTLLSPLIFLATFSRIINVNASFNLNASGPDWDYVAKDLANTTSKACMAAYGTDLDCDATLLGLVASMRPTFKPTSTDFDNTCTITCSDSLDAYLKGIQEACTADGDAAQEYVGGSTPEALVPVEIVAQVFQYILTKDCTKSAATAASQTTTSTSSTTLSGSSITTSAISNRTSSPSIRALAESSSTTPTAASVTTNSGAIEVERSLGLVFLGIFSAMFII